MQENSAIASVNWKTSHYTRLIDVPDQGGVLYNGLTGALIQLSDDAFERMQGYLIPDEPIDHEGEPLFEHLIAGGYVVSQETNELQVLMDDFREQRLNAKLMLTVLPTFSCNLGCGYCFVGKKAGVMTKTRQEEVIDFVAERLETTNPPSMVVEWLGGEPTIATDGIAHMSQAFMKLCEKKGIDYSAMVISNGTLIKEDTVQFLEENNIDRIQITLDGPQEVHDSRRFYKAGNKGSFDVIMKGLEHLVGKIRVHLRINVDSRNLDAVMPLMDMFEERGWIGPDQQFFPYLARIAPFNDGCSWVEEHSSSQKAFHDTHFEWMKRLHRAGVKVAGEGMYNFPDRMFYNCSAVGNNGFVVSPEGELHKCSLSVDNSDMAIGKLGEPLDYSEKKLSTWEGWWPFNEEQCSKCTYLPSCLGGCPHDRMTGNEYGVTGTCEFHHKFEDKIIARHMELLNIPV